MDLTKKADTKNAGGFWRRLKSDQRGASTVEYVIVVGLVSLAAFTIFGNLGQSIATKTGQVNDRVNQINP